MSLIALSVVYFGQSILLGVVVALAVAGVVREQVLALNGGLCAIPRCIDVHRVMAHQRVVDSMGVDVDRS